jgi:hypothetical protein
MGAASSTLNLAVGWNLLGNSSSAPIDVAATFGDAAKFTSVWKWNRATSAWAFYAPSMAAPELAIYTQSKGYDTLTSIGPKEGFWVNASTAAVSTGPAGSAVLLAEDDLQPGWNLVASAENKTPSDLNQRLRCGLNSSGKSMVTAWAWNASLNSWKFFSPMLEVQGTSVLASYIASKGYAPFDTAVSASEGFWLNIGSAGGSSAVARIEILQTGLLLTREGDTRQLSAVAYDAAGNVLGAPVTWTSTSPENISVDSGGKVTAITANGSGQIVAEVDCVKSAPLLVVVTDPVADAVLLTDSQIVGTPVETDPNAVPSFSNTYQVVLSGVSPPAIGAILLGTESKPVAGRVVAVSVAGSNATVTLQMVSIPEILPNLNLNETIDLSRAPMSFSPEIAAAFDILRTGNSFTFTPKASSTSNLSSAMSAFSSSSQPLPYKCEGELAGVTVDKPPFDLNLLKVKVEIKPTVEYVDTLGSGFQRLVLNATPTLTIDAGIKTTAAFEAKYKCELKLGEFTIPVAGALSFLASGVVPWGIVIEAGGKMTLADWSIGVTSETRGTVRIGLECPGGTGCAFGGNLGNFTTSLTPKVDPPSVADFRVEPEVKVYLYLEAQVGSPIFKSLRFDAFKATAGGAFKGSFAPQLYQVLDTEYSSDYKVSLEADAKLGLKIDEVLSLLGKSSIVKAELSVSKDVAVSPKAVAVTANKGRFVSGDTVNFKVRMDSGTTNFFPLIGPYNIGKILLVRRTPGQLTTAIVGSASAASGQTSFDFSYSAQDSGTVDEFYAFVVTKLLPSDFLSLELGRASGEDLCDYYGTLEVRCYYDEGKTQLKVWEDINQSSSFLTIRLYPDGVGNTNPLGHDKIIQYKVDDPSYIGKQLFTQDKQISAQYWPDHLSGFAVFDKVNWVTTYIRVTYFDVFTEPDFHNYYIEQTPDGINVYEIHYLDPYGSRAITYDMVNAIFPFERIDSILYRLNNP